MTTLRSCKKNLKKIVVKGVLTQVVCLRFDINNLMLKLEHQTSITILEDTKKLNSVFTEYTNLG